MKPCERLVYTAHGEQAVENVKCPASGQSALRTRAIRGEGEMLLARVRDREMRETIRCCISPASATHSTYVVRIVHVSECVEEIISAVIADDIMQVYPKHVLRKPPSASWDGVEVPKVVTLLLDAELQRRKILRVPPTYLILGNNIISFVG
ncbi:hypothetical protein Cni_G01304 [Canna indica]|uniref:Uncharacterized protein n=1 Tax=Canna indica TaxID=4628 RepID=A0AAQ3JME2_9LILI|nr:hypothetical protein Cni_G01304 [Canna indica]